MTNRLYDTEELILDKEVKVEELALALIFFRNQLKCDRPYVKDMLAQEDVELPDDY